MEDLVSVDSRKLESKRRTRKSLEWIEEWKTSRVAQSVMVESKPDSSYSQDGTGSVKSVAPEKRATRKKVEARE
jgi:hypothetical protein